jgi:ATP/maltotriose-dependent transcriptional regulator MalT
LVHAGERGDFISAPTGSGKTEAIRAWLRHRRRCDRPNLTRSRHKGETLDELPMAPLRLSFVVIDDYEPAPQSDRAIINVVRDTPQTVHFVIATRHEPSTRFRVLIEEGTVRLTCRGHSHG